MTSDAVLLDLPSFRFFEPDGRAPSILKSAWSLWQSLPRRNGLPAYTAFDPTRIGRLLPHILLTEVLRDPLDFRFKVVGTHIEERMGKPIRGPDWANGFKPPPVPEYGEHMKPPFDTGRLS